MAVTESEKVATFMHAGYSNILRRTEGGRKKTTTENQRFSVVFYGLIDPSVIRLGLEPRTPTLKVLFPTPLNSGRLFHLNLIETSI